MDTVFLSKSPQIQNGCQFVRSDRRNLFSYQEVVDLTDGCGGKFSVVIVSDKFEGKPLLAQHRMVNDCLVEELKTIHALTIKTMKPAQWEKQEGT